MFDKNVTNILIKYKQNLIKILRQNFVWDKFVYETKNFFP